MHPLSHSSTPRSVGIQTLRRSLLGGVLCLCLLNCSSAPDLSQNSPDTDEDTVWPTLLDSTTLASVSQSSSISSAQNVEVQTLQTRLAALRLRAANLSARPVLTASDRAKLQSAVTRHN